MALYEFVKEVKQSGDVFYFTEKDGSFVDNSLSSDKEKAFELFQKIIRNPKPYREIIKSTNIPNDEHKED